MEVSFYSRLSHKYIKLNERSPWSKMYIVPFKTLKKEQIQKDEFYTRQKQKSLPLKAIWCGLKARFPKPYHRPVVCYCKFLFYTWTAVAITVFKLNIGSKKCV